MKKIKNIKIIVSVLVVLVALYGAAMFWQRSSKASDSMAYTDTDYHFSFLYPRVYHARSFSDLEDTKTVLVEDQDIKQGLQVFVSPFDEDITLTTERIKKEMPDLVVLEPQNISMDGVTGVAFRSTNALSTESSELWFVHNGNLYQVSAPVTSKDLFDAIITKWKWNE